MKVLTLLLMLSPLTSFAADMVCQYRFNPRLAVTVTMEDRFLENSRKGGVSWDDKNVCAGDICTEIYPGTFGVRFRDLTPPNTQGVVRLKIRSIDRRDDLGNRYRPNSLFGNFVRNAIFTSIVIPEPNLRVRWGGRTYRMSCRETETI